MSIFVLQNKTVILREKNINYRLLLFIEGVIKFRKCARITLHCVCARVASCDERERAARRR